MFPCHCFICHVISHNNSYGDTYSISNRRKRSPLSDFETQKQHDSNNDGEDGDDKMEDYVMHSRQL